MHLPSLSLLTTLACAAFSIAAPLSTPVDVDGAKDKVENTVHKVPRDVPATPTPPTAPETPVAPLEITLTALYNDLQPAIAALCKSQNLLFCCGTSNTNR